MNMQINVLSPAATSLTKSCGKHCNVNVRFEVLVNYYSDGILDSQ